MMSFYLFCKSQSHFCPPIPEPHPPYSLLRLLHELERFARTTVSQCQSCEVEGHLIDQRIRFCGCNIHSNCLPKTDNKRRKTTRDAGNNKLSARPERSCISFSRVEISSCENPSAFATRPYISLAAVYCTW